MATWNWAVSRHPLTPTSSTKASILPRKEKVDFILAVGGGSVMDSAKGIALGVPYDGDFWDFYCGKKGPVTEALPVGCVVTIAASGSEGSTDSVVTLDTEDGHEYKRCADGGILRPLFAIMNQN